MLATTKTLQLIGFYFIIGSVSVLVHVDLMDQWKRGGRPALRMQHASVIAKSRTSPLEPEALLNSTTQKLPKELPKINSQSKAARTYPGCVALLNNGFPPELSETPWNDVDFRRPSCGKKKCFYNSHTNPNAGYLITQTTSFDNMQKAQNLEEELAQRFGAHVVSLPGEGPQRLNISQSMACLLTLSVRQPGTPDNATELKAWKPSELSAVAFQKRRKAPEPYFLYKTRHLDYDEFREFLTKHVALPNQFLHNLEADLDRAREICTAHPHLLNDFQFLIDAEGHVIHIDVDRNFASSYSSGGDRFSQEKQQERLRVVKAQLPQILKVVRHYASSLRSNSQ